MDVLVLYNDNAWFHNDFASPEDLVLEIYAAFASANDAMGRSLLANDVKIMVKDVIQVGAGDATRHVVMEFLRG